MEAKDFLKYKNWVVAGDVLNEMKYAGRIYQKLNRRGYRVAGLHPKEENPSVFKSFQEMEGEDEKYEVLNLVINPTRGLEIVKEAEAYGIKMVLAQPGARSYEIQDFCVKHGMEYVEGCTLVELSY
ncbi:CoA-binding protein [Proteiniclasticum ruminis]|mgnify:CR=1 FL=1|uniref:CoA-binding protein n=1 Tax=Proteiniclasticum ruminis TaxID=398199 RepID=UPI0028A1D7EF|nr:CoA-binding protein [Proteiniclasticum ruminis]